MNSLISILMILLSAITIPIALIPDNLKRWRFWSHIGLCCSLAAVGVLNQYLTDKSQEEFDAELQKMATSYRWDEAVIEAQGHFIPAGTKVSLALLITDNDVAIKQKTVIPWNPGNGINEVASYSDDDAVAMIRAVSGNGEIRKMHENGTYSIWAEGIVGADGRDVAICAVKDYTRLPNRYPSLHDLNGKVIMGILRIDHPQAVATFLTIRLKIPSGYKDFCYPFKLLHKGSLIASSTRYFAFEPTL
jgi:hypothetical protein